MVKPPGCALVNSPGYVRTLSHFSQTHEWRSLQIISVPNCLNPPHPSPCPSWAPRHCGAKVGLSHYWPVWTPLRILRYEKMIIALYLTVWGWFVMQQENAFLSFWILCSALSEGSWVVLLVPLGSFRLRLGPFILQLRLHYWVKPLVTGFLPHSCEGWEASHMQRPLRPILHLLHTSFS